MNSAVTLSGAKQTSWGTYWTFIYVLCDPDTDAVRYVGRTQNPRARYSGHMTGKYEYQPKVDWICSLLGRGKMPQMIIIALCDGDGKKQEAYFINLFAEQGCDLLQSVNHIPGNWPCKDRVRSAKTHCKNGHALTPENTRIHANGARICYTCQREYHRTRKVRMELIHARRDQEKHNTDYWIDRPIVES